MAKKIRPVSSTMISLSLLEQETHFRIDRCLTCFDGKMTLDAVQYETGLRRNHLRDLLTIFKEDVSPA